MFILCEGKCDIYSNIGDFSIDPEKNTVFVTYFEESREITNLLFPGAYMSSDEAIGAKYENLYDFDKIFINRPDNIVVEKHTSAKTEVYISKRHLAIYTQDELLKQVMNKYISNGQEVPSNAEILKELFKNIFSDDMVLMNNIEDNLSRLEIEVVEKGNNQASVTKKLLEIRKNLLSLNRYYSAMFDLLEDLEENLNSIFTQEEIKHFRIHTNKADRLQGEIKNLQEYATQVREAYQSQLDIQQNKVMQFFTVVTSIFLPLTLIVGWYGMNLKMPEFGSPIAYPIVIGVSIVIAISLIIYFRKKKWF